jgi:hypothetical protein
LAVLAAVTEAGPDLAAFDEAQAGHLPAKDYFLSQQTRPARSRAPSPLLTGPLRLWAAEPLSRTVARQVAMLEEMCIVVDADDNILGEDTKKNLHLTSGPCMREGGVPHRAFSAFVFNSAGELLMQQVCRARSTMHW